ncbi:ABC transporter permease [Roseicitreum antarcticum]|uniref:Putative thiamine transport system permease protein n=1 Tax=Roseicitreum antarcticum TaxID=564137 RepID=A0A1H2QYK8_9RHOB|nr:ABC transporter permease [Roseicitreum antarcticum]SDW11970.1 putative thiamine transport system permease protein [Roseicitreum antarcticum]
MSATRFAPALTIALLTGPVIAGCIGIVLPAFGYLPALGGLALSLEPWRALLDWPGLGIAVRHSIATGVSATGIALFITLLILAAWQGSRVFVAITRALSPLLSVPHAAAALGLAFLLAPSGWIARALSPWATGWQRPPDLLIVNDPLGLTLIAGLVIKEVPFLLLMSIAALSQIDSGRTLLLTQTMGYGRIMGWVKVVLPQLYPQIRLPVMAVLAYSVSVVDMAMILGPTRPPTLAVQILDWMGNPDLAYRFQASAAAVLQLFVAAAALLAWRLTEGGVAQLSQRWLTAGARGRHVDRVARPVALGLAGLSVGAVAFGLAGLAVWSFAGLWRFPDLWPQTLNLQTWDRQATGLTGAITQTVIIGLLATGAAIVLTLACLQAEYRRDAAVRRALLVLYVPLLVPQVAFVPGLTTLTLIAGVAPSVWLVALVHLVFVLPYVFLSLSDPWRTWDRRAGVVAHALGASHSRVFWAVRLPMLSRAIAVACAVGFATSVAQYLPTLLISAGRIDTLTTEAVALGSGGNRRVIGAYALAQMLAPFVGFALALGIPALLWRNRQGMRVT